MTYIAKPRLHHPLLKPNGLGFTRRDYEGKVSTLCAGCGHDSISAAIIQACYDLDLPPHRLAKLSGIGCSSKTPDYFLGNSHGFNSVHGRMPSVLTGANLANRELIYLGVSGDGDSASIGLGQFAHAIRRGVNMTYIVENNGVYGLTKGQFSATSDKGSKSKKGAVNHDQPIDLVGLALQLGAGFVGPQLLRRQGAADPADQGRDPAQGRGLHRRHLALRAVQQPRRLDQELRLCARAQRRGEPAGRDRRARRDHRRLCARDGRTGHAARRLGAEAEQAARTTTIPPIGSRPSASCRSHHAARRDPHRPALCRSRRPGTCTIISARWPRRSIGSATPN